MKSNLTLIGMPGAGKSTIGIILAKVLACGFIDTDVLIQINRQSPLQSIIDESDYLNLRKIEEEEILKLNVVNHIIATGGSAVYSEKAMRHLQNSSAIIFLKVGFKELTRRIHNYETRGIAGPEQQSFQELYDERQPLYEKYADVVIDCANLDQDEIALEIAKTHHQKGVVMEKSKKRIIVTVIGSDEIGIVAKVATVLAENQINIIDINQKIMGGEIFAMTLLADRVSSELSLAEITTKLKESTQGMSVEVTVQDSEVFQYMHRV